MIPHTGKLASSDYPRDFVQAADELGFDDLAVSMGAAFAIQADPDRKLHRFRHPEGGVPLEA